MSEQPPKAGTISADKLVELTGYSDRRHRQLAKDGYFPPPFRGQYQATKTLQGLFKHFQEQVAKKNTTAKAAEERLAIAKADMAEDERDRLRKLWVLKSEIGPALRNISLHQRAVLQRKLEQEVGPNLAGRKTPEILSRLRAAVDEICELFQSGVGSWMEIEPEEVRDAEDSIPTNKK